MEVLHSSLRINRAKYFYNRYLSTDIIAEVDVYAVTIINLGVQAIINLLVKKKASSANLLPSNKSILLN